MRAQFLLLTIVLLIGEPALACSLASVNSLVDVVLSFDSKDSSTPTVIVRRLVIVEYANPSENTGKQILHSDIPSGLITIAAKPDDECSRDVTLKGKPDDIEKIVASAKHGRLGLILSEDQGALNPPRKHMASQPDGRKESERSPVKFAFRAFSLPWRTGADSAKFFEPGLRVDIYQNRKGPDGAQECTPIIRNAIILSMGISSGSQKGTVSLSVSPDDVRAFLQGDNKLPDPCIWPAPAASQAKSAPVQLGTCDCQPVSKSEWEKSKDEWREWRNDRKRATARNNRVGHARVTTNGKTFILDQSGTLQEHRSKLLPQTMNE